MGGRSVPSAFGEGTSRPPMPPRSLRGGLVRLPLRSPG